MIGPAVILHAPEGGRGPTAARHAKRVKLPDVDGWDANGGAGRTAGGNRGLGFRPRMNAEWTSAMLVFICAVKAIAGPLLPY